MTCENCELLMARIRNMELTQAKVDQVYKLIREENNRLTKVFGLVARMLSGMDEEMARVRELREKRLDHNVQRKEVLAP